ncbi:hypothetical protein AB0F44_11070 [Nocardioides sp. NPDC023903]|uniref:hypothetical protein n=1 Tax=Nocardioides sp. NPDC023903 TaxID=3157195 RepID=UPI0033FF6C68
MSEQAQPQWPTVVPYVESYSGATRVMTLEMASTAKEKFIATMPPIVAIDGRDYWVYWGQVSFEIPAERACHVSVRCEGGQSGGQYSQDLGFRVASALLPPGAEPVRMQYLCHFASGVGSITMS